MLQLKWLSALAAFLIFLVPYVVVCQVVPGGSFDSAPNVVLSTETQTFMPNMNISQLEDHYYLLVGAEPGLKLSVDVSIKSKSGGMLMVSLFTEGRAKVLDYKFVTRDGEEKIISLDWLTAKKQGFYLKVSSVGGEHVYNVTAKLLDRRDMGKGDAGEKIESSMYVGVASSEQSLSFTGFLASAETGDDFVDFYEFGTQLNRTEAVLIAVSPSEGMSCDASIHLADGFRVTYNGSTSPGKPFTLMLKGDIAGNKTFYLKVSNMDGHGGGGRYSVYINVFNLVAPKLEPKVPINLVDKELARQLIIISVAVIAGMTVVALVLRRRSTSAEEWYGAYQY